MTIKAENVERFSMNLNGKSIEVVRENFKRGLPKYYYSPNDDECYDSLTLEVFTGESLNVEHDGGDPVYHPSVDDDVANTCRLTAILFDHASDLKRYEDLSARLQMEKDARVELILKNTGSFSNCISSMRFVFYFKTDEGAYRFLSDCRERISRRYLLEWHVHESDLSESREEKCSQMREYKYELESRANDELEKLGIKHESDGLDSFEEKSFERLFPRSYKYLCSCRTPLPSDFIRQAETMQELEDIFAQCKSDADAFFKQDVEDLWKFTPEGKAKLESESQAQEKLENQRRAEKFLQACYQRIDDFNLTETEIEGQIYILQMYTDDESMIESVREYWRKKQSQNDNATEENEMKTENQTMAIETENQTADNTNQTS